MCNGTTKIRVDSRVVSWPGRCDRRVGQRTRVAEADRPAALAILCRFRLGRNWTRNFWLLLSCFLCLLGDNKFNQMLKPAEEVNLSCLVLISRAVSRGK